MKFTIEGELTDLNAYIKALNRSRWSGNDIKQQETERVTYEARAAKLPPVSRYPVRISFAWYSKNSRKDIDNVAFAKKFIMDGLVEAGVLKGDGRKHIAGFAGEEFLVDGERPRVEIVISSS